MAAHARRRHAWIEPYAHLPTSAPCALKTCAEYPEPLNLCPLFLLAEASKKSKKLPLRLQQKCNADSINNRGPKETKRRDTPVDSQKEQAPQKTKNNENMTGRGMRRGSEGPAYCKKPRNRGGKRGNTAYSTSSGIELSAITKTTAKEGVQTPPVGC